jgi:hypothetical protein
MIRIIVAAALATTASAAWSQNAAAGKIFYDTPILGLSCGDAGSCHGPNPNNNVKNIKNGANAPAVILAAPDKVNQMAFLKGRISAQNAADLAAYIANPAAAAVGGIALSATNLSFASTQVATTNSTSSPASLVVTNNGGGPLTITGFAKGGTNAAEFTATGSCVGASVSVAPGATCTLGASFTPAAVGTRVATLTFQSNAATNPTITVSGIAAAAATPSLSISTAAITFNSQTVGTTSAARPVVVTNSGTVPVSITQAAAAPTPEFAAAGACVGTLAAGASCTMNVTFTPPTTGARTGSLTITSNATGSPHAVALNGPGVSTPTGAAAITSTALSFPQTVVSSAATPLRATLTNTGNAMLTINSVTIAGPNAGDFRLGAGNTCAPGGLAVNASCQVEAEFRPTSAGTKSADVVVAHSVGNTTVALGGMAAAPDVAAPAAAPSSSPLVPSNVGGGGAINPWLGLLALLMVPTLCRRLHSAPR